MRDKLPLYVSIGLMVCGFLGMTVGADVVSSGTLSVLLASVGGVAVIVGGIWGFRTEEQRGGFDERYFQITLRGTAFSLWAFYWAVLIWSQVEGSTDITVPVLEPLTWLLLVPWVAFGITYVYYTRNM